MRSVLIKGRTAWVATVEDDDEQLRLAIIPVHLAGKRLDQALAELFPEYSRSRLAGWIKDGRVLLDAQRPRPREKVLGGEEVSIELEPEIQTTLSGEPIALSLVYEDADILVIDKPVGLVVHPGAGNPNGTLVNALLFHDPGLAALPRAGVVHRLDKDTTGLMVVARSLRAHKALVEQLQARTVSREYQAIVQGVLTAGGTIEAPIGRHPVDRTRMAVRENGRAAVTHYRVIERYRHHSLLRVMLETGRTHQIRVHMAQLRHAIVGDPVYGGRLAVPRGATLRLGEALRALRRQALHACRLCLVHPVTGVPMSWDSPLPGDMQALVEALREDARLNGEA
jgi:23S rRNA pseudouridine1911/1915/1917 synthase